MKNFILTHYPIIKQVIFYMSIIFATSHIFFIVPVVVGHFQILNAHYTLLKKFRHGNKSPANQLELIIDQTRAIQHTIDAALQSSDLSTKHYTEIHRILQRCEIIQRNSPLYPSSRDSYLDDLDELMDRLEDIVPPALYSLNPYFFQTTPPKITPLKWCKQKVRCNYFIATSVCFLSLSYLIAGIKFPRLLNISFLPIVFLSLYVVHIYRYLNKDHKDIDKECLKFYQSNYNYMLFVLLLTLILYVIFRFLLFS